MPVTDVKVTLRVASSDQLRPRSWQGSGIAIEATILDQSGEPIAGAVANLSWITPAGIEMRQSGLVSDAAGKFSAVLSIADAGSFVARCVVISPQSEVAEARFEMVAGSVALDAIQAVPVATPGGAVLVLSNGNAIGGVV